MAEHVLAQRSWKRLERINSDECQPLGVLLFRSGACRKRDSEAKLGVGAKRGAVCSDRLDSAVHRL